MNTANMLQRNNVRVIQATKTHEILAMTQRLKVAAYARVSTDTEDQLNSFYAQSKYYNDTLSQKSDIEYVGLYADEGITGTLIKKEKTLSD